MSRRAVPGVTHSTMGQSSLSDLALGKPYRYNKDPDWVPGDSRYRVTETRRPGPPPGTRNSPADKARRFAVFCAAIADGKTVPEAGIAAGVRTETAQKYDRERRRQQREESRNA